MVWTVRLARRRAYRTRAVPLDILSISFYALVPFGLSSPQSSKTHGRRLLPFAFIGVEAVFALLRWRRNIRLIIPVMRINQFYYLGGLTEGSETILLFCSELPFRPRFPWFA